MSNYPDGMTVIICCYNSMKRLPQTLDALARQQCHVAWELLVVDNASDDGSACYAAGLWKALKPNIPIRLVHEPRPGLSHARKTGIRAALYANVLFCDDDNQLSEPYLQGMYNMLMSDPQTAACGGMGIPVFETKEPAWFREYAEAYALGSQTLNSENGTLLNLYGAGLAVKRSALDRLYGAGFNSVLEDRTGKLLSSAGDTELTYALVLLGYRLQCSDAFTFGHFLSRERLGMDYLKRLFTAFGNDGPVRNLYYSYVSRRASHKLISKWPAHFALSLVRLVKYWLAPPKKYGRSIYLSWNIAYIRSLWSIRKQYPGLRNNILKLTATASPGLPAAETGRDNRSPDTKLNLTSSL